MWEYGGERCGFHDWMREGVGAVGSYRLATEE
jgi:hypothetical protein